MCSRAQSSVSTCSHKIAAIEKIVQVDIGGRGIGAFTPPEGELFYAASGLYDAACSNRDILILTGFPCLLDYSPPTETDGPLGAVSIARAVMAVQRQHSGGRCILVTDACNAKVINMAVQAANLDSSLVIETFQPKGTTWTAEEESRLNLLGRNAAATVAIERAGPGADGGSYTMRGLDMTHLLAPLERLLSPSVEFGSKENAASQTTSHSFVSIGIGDGGNEVGMGKMRDAVLSSTVPMAEKVSCVVPADHLIVCGISNWGGTALASALMLLAHNDRRSPDEANAQRNRNFADLAAAWNAGMPSEEDDTAILNGMIAAGCRDGCTKLNEATVDGFPFEKSLQINRDIKAIFLS